MSPPGRILRVVATNVAATFALLIGIEMLVRSTNPSITPVGTSRELIADSVFGAAPGPNPGATGLSNGARFNVDQRGFWQYSQSVDSARPGWLFIGDSVTMGIGVEPDSTFAGILHRALASHYEVMNPSLVGYSSNHYRSLIRYFLRTGHRGAPDLQRITIFWCLNDAFHGSQVDQPDGRLRHFAEPLLSILYRYAFTYQWLKAKFLDRPKRYYLHDARLYDGEPLDRAVSDLTEIAESCDRYAVTCDIVLLPYEYQLRLGQIQPQNILAERLADLSFRLHDPFAWLAGRTNDSSELFLYGDGIHFSESGHRLIAEFVLDRLVARTTAEQARTTAEQARTTGEQ